MTSQADGSEEVRGLPPRARPVESEGWILRVFGFLRRFGIESGESAPLVAAAISLGLFVLGGLVTAGLHAVLAVEGSVIYHTTPVFYTYTLWMFFFLWLVGHWSRRYLRMWESLRPTFDVTDEEFAETVDRGLSYVYRLDVPILLFVPTQIAIEILSPFSIASWAPLPETLVFKWFQVVVNFLHVLVVYLLFVHVALVKRVASLPLSNLYSAAAELEPLAEFSVSMAVKYFANLAVLFFAWLFVMDVEPLEFTGGGDVLETLGLGGWEFAFLLAAPSVYLLVGLFVFLYPMQALHSRLREERRERLIRLDREYSDLLEESIGEADDDGTLDRLKELNRIRDQLEGMRLWPFRLPGLVKVSISVLSPFVVYTLDLLRDAWL